MGGTQHVDLHVLGQQWKTKERGGRGEGDAADAWCSRRAGGHMGVGEAAAHCLEGRMEAHPSRLGPALPPAPQAWTSWAPPPHLGYCMSRLPSCTPSLSWSPPPPPPLGYCKRTLPSRTPGLSWSPPPPSTPRLLQEHDPQPHTWPLMVSLPPPIPPPT